MSETTWTRELPTEPGYYWVRDAIAMDGLHVVEVFMYDPAPRTREEKQSLVRSGMLWLFTGPRKERAHLRFRLGNDNNPLGGIRDGLWWPIPITPPEAPR